MEKRGARRLQVQENVLHHHSPGFISLELCWIALGSTSSIDELAILVLASSVVQPRKPAASVSWGLGHILWEEKNLTLPSPMPWLAQALSRSIDTSAPLCNCKKLGIRSAIAWKTSMTHFL
jgi:hypothetical protein